MSGSTVEAVTRFVESSINSLIMGALNTTDYLFPKGDNPVTKLFFNSVHLVDQLKEYEKPILTTVGCAAVTMGTVLAGDSGAVVGFLASIGTVVIWHELEDKSLIDTIVQRIFKQQALVDVEAEDVVVVEKEDVNLDEDETDLTYLIGIIKNPNEMEMVKRLAFEDLKDSTKDFLSDKTFDFVIRALKDIVESNELKKSLQKQAFFQLSKLISMDWVLQPGKETGICAFEEIINNTDISDDLRDLAYDELIKIRKDSLEDVKFFEWITKILQESNFKKPQFFFHDVFGNLHAREYGKPHRLLQMRQTLQKTNI